MKLSDIEIWEALERGKVELDHSGEVVDAIPGLHYYSALAYGEPLQEAGLWIAVIVQAGKEGDIDYFNNRLFEIHCWLAGLSPEKVREIIVDIWEKLEI